MEFSLSTIAAAVAAATPDRTFFIQRETRLSYAQFVGRAHQLGNALHERDLGCHTERTDLENYESGQDHLALCMYSCPEYLEALVGAYSARVAPFNVNYRYVDDELVYLLCDQRATGAVFHSAFAPTFERIGARVPSLRVLLQVPDHTGNELIAGAEWYADALAGRPKSAPPVECSPDDLYVLCTGGTTGMPKGVLWRQADIFAAALGGVSTRLHREYESMAEIVDEAIDRGERFRNMPTAPFMHGAAQWSALTALTHGNACVLPTNARSLDPADVWETVERERVTMMQIVGDAFARPLLDELDRRAYDLDALKIIMNGGAILSAGAKQRLLDHLPHVTVGDGLGSSEGGAFGVSASTSNDVATSVFDLAPGVCVLSADLTRELETPEDEIGWIATTGRMPLGYLGDGAKTAATFPTIGATRYSVPGDRVRLVAGGRIELHGRDSGTINSGGEKIYAEEVEQALMAHPDVADIVVCGRPSERWGSEVVAVVALRAGAVATAAELVASASSKLAAYKLPKAIVFRDHIARSPAGKADYRWAQAQVADFRNGVRSFLAANLPAGFRGLGGFNDDSEVEDFVTRWRQLLFEHRYLAVAWPEEYGGRGLSATEAVIVAEELTRAGAPLGGPNDGFGIRLCGSALLQWGTDEQKAYYLPRILSGVDKWCQGYSEPRAGSDLANLGTRAVLEGEQWILNGQKIWTSAGHLADHMFLLCRTDADAPKHRGITFLLLDMRQPGVEVRPITMMSGAVEFNEVFLTDAVVPTDDVVGGVNNGWAVAMTVLGYERGESTATEVIRFQAEFDRLRELARHYGKHTDPIMRQRLAWCYSKVQIMQYLSAKVLTALLADEPPGPEASLGKLFCSEYHQQVTSLAIDIMGADALTPTGRRPLGTFGPGDGGAPTSTASWATSFLNARSGTIYAGTSEIQRNVIAEKILGLPKEPRADTGPWSRTNER